MEGQRAGKEGQRGDGSLLPKMTNPQSVSQSAGTGGSGMRVEVWMASPEPAVGVFTPAGTCQGRLWRHFVIGCAAP